MSINVRLRLKFSFDLIRSGKDHKVLHVRDMVDLTMKFTYTGPVWKIYDLVYKISTPRFKMYTFFEGPLRHGTSITAPTKIYIFLF